MELFDASILAKELISQYVPQYRFSWNSLKTKYGVCSYSNRTIYLSRHLTPLRTEAAVRQTIMHEIAHALTPGAGHGMLWKIQMQRFGYKPERCSSDVVDKSSISNWKATCPGCAKVVYMVRKPRVVKSCGKCGHGKFNRKYILEFKKI